MWGKLLISSFLCILCIQRFHPVDFALHYKSGLLLSSSLWPLHEKTGDSEDFDVLFKQTHFCSLYSELVTKFHSELQSVEIALTTELANICIPAVEEIGTFTYVKNPKKILKSALVFLILPLFDYIALIILNRFYELFTYSC